MPDLKRLHKDSYDIPSYGMSFTFDYVKQDNGTIHIYILRQPAYKPGQAIGGHETHRYGLGEERPYICYDPMPRSLSSAKAISAEWARRTAYYIRYGRWLNKSS
ncbi:hypothetical protein [uncultured Pseudodesulfovibrio sp.]|uniref:hypothetical protein n=1 Tax=uncultured Pseudodesulfovibrio sp. TaxID=2035858 RepID=UPI0029C757E2|nr:hypothetical protein [uncultured Pseudodesulfovibrio sp.]